MRQRSRSDQSRLDQNNRFIRGEDLSEYDKQDTAPAPPAQRCRAGMTASEIRQPLRSRAAKQEIGEFFWKRRPGF